MILFPDAIEVSPWTRVGVDDETGRELVETIDEDYPYIHGWGVYLHYPNYGVVHVADFKTQAEAEAIAASLPMYPYDTTNDTFIIEEKK